MQRDFLRELAQLVRFHDSDDRNIGPFVAEHACELAHLLSSHESELRDAVHERDGQLVDRIGVRLDIAHERERQQQHEHEGERACRAANEVGRTARWFDLGVALDVDVVLGDLLADPRCKVVAFKLPTTTVRIATSLLRRARILRRTYIDAGVFVDDDGIHFRWKGGRGALNLRAQEPHDRAAYDALIIELPPQRVQHPTLVGDVLVEIGFGL